MLAQLGETRETSPVLARGIDALLADQEKDGSWFGRWGMNYIYGTWSSLCALSIAGQDPQSEPMRRAVTWLERIQNPDGGWGESGGSYKLDYKGYEPAPSTASQTAWAVLGLMAAGEADHPAVARGIAYLAATQGDDGLWNEPFHTATGFPGCSIYATTAIPSFFRFGRWPAIAISNAATAEPPLSACEAPRSPGFGEQGRPKLPARVHENPALLSQSGHIYFTFSSRLWISGRIPLNPVSGHCGDL